jgi:hypothetical protein
MTPEKAQLRHLLYGNKPHVYRAIFRVVEKHKRVDGLSIRHDAKFSGSILTRPAWSLFLWSKR